MKIWTKPCRGVLSPHFSYVLYAVRTVPTRPSPVLRFFARRHYSLHPTMRERHCKRLHIPKHQRQMTMIRWCCKSWTTINGGCSTSHRHVGGFFVNGGLVIIFVDDCSRLFVLTQQQYRWPWPDDEHHDGDQREFFLSPVTSTPVSFVGDFGWIDGWWLSTEQAKPFQTWLTPDDRNQFCMLFSPVCQQTRFDW